MGINEQLIPRLSIKDWVQVTRLPFLTASIVPLLIAFSYAAYQGNAINGFLIIATLFSLVFLHLGANVINDYYDHLSSADEENQHYISPFTGGSRSIQTGLISAQATRNIALLLFALSFIIGLPILFYAGAIAVLLGLFGLITAYYYTAPPLRLAARYGLGELVIALDFGPLLVLGGYLAITGELSWSAFLAGLPIGFLVMAIIYINEFPDYESDRKVGKNTLVVAIGKKSARIGYFAIVALCFLSLVALVLVGILPKLSLVALFSAFILVEATPVVLHDYDSPRLGKANAATIKLHSVFGLLLAASLVVSKLVL